MEPIRNFLRHKKAAVKYYEAEATKIDYENKVVYIDDESEIKGASSKTTVPFDMLVVGVGAENATFGASYHEAESLAWLTTSRHSRCPRERPLPEGGRRRPAHPCPYHGLL
jgi:NADH dehydrogenase FAD-containing subunit